MKGKWTLYLDQYGQHVFASTLRELRAKVGGGRVSKMYIDLVDGTSRHIGYVVGKRWFRAYVPFEAAP